MNKRAILILGIVALILLSFSLGTAQRNVPPTTKLRAFQVPPDKAVSLTPPVAAEAKDYCFLQYHDYTGPFLAYQWWNVGDKVAIYFDPTDCGNPQNYPFQLTDVEFALWDFAGVGTVDVRFSVEILCPDICDGPGIEIYKSPIYTITDFGVYVTIDFPDTICLDKPFFFNLEYMSGEFGSIPSVYFTDISDVVDTCYQWVWFGQPSWIEWYNVWTSPPPGWIVMGISGYTGEEQTDCGWWYWKPDTTEAPSGMPDFDQNQDEWVAFCGPTAVANCLWWFNAVPTGMTPPDFIELLAGYFSTTASGTHVDSIQAGLDRYFEDFGFALTETTYWMPDFYEMEDSLKVCQDIILLLGFWWWDDYYEEWYREGGHFVTMAGVNSEKKEIAISDPDRDQCVQYTWWPGRVRPTTHPPWGGYPPTLHNDPLYVSHDVYISLLYPEFPSPGSQVWELADYCYEWYKYANMNVPDRFSAVTKPAPKHLEYFHVEVEAAVMICPKPPPDTLRNHFKTWLIDPQTFFQTVLVQDQFMSDSLVLDAIEFFSNPARKDTFEIVDRFEHLTWYRAYGRDTLLEVEYTNQFGTDTVRIDSVKYLLLPTAKETYPFPESLDHYKAYRIKNPVEFDRDVVLEDQFDVMYGAPEFIETLKPIYFLTPALKNYEEPMFDPITHYVAYEIFPKRVYPIPVNTFDQFGSHSLYTDQAEILLVPTEKLWAEPPPNDPPEIGQPDFLEGYVDSVVEYDITGTDPDGDVILDEASITIIPGCGSGYSITRTSGHGTSSGTWSITWFTDGCTPCDTHMVIHDLTDETGLVGYCTTWVHLSAKPSDSLWYWKPDTTNAPSGMPDFDQYQFGPPDSLGMCGPTAVANCLWWFGAVPTTIDDPGDFIRLLSDYFKTDPTYGTYVDSIQLGLDRYFQDYGFALQETTYWMPDFYEMEDSLKVCQDIILLLGFWYWDEYSGEWYREGGHFVTMAGVCSESLKIAISDPARDAAETGWPGRVRPAYHPPHPGNHILHNNPLYISHDMYQSVLDNPFPSPGNPFWELGDYFWAKGEFTNMNVPERFAAVSKPAPEEGKQIFATEVEAAIMICPKPEERECDVLDPKECDTLWVECGNMRVPPGGGLVTVDLTIANDESL